MVLLHSHMVFSFSVIFFVQMALVPQMLQLQASRPSSSSPPKSHLLASPRSLHSGAAGTRRVCNSAIKVEQSTLVQPHMLVPQQSKANIDTQTSLLAAIRRYFMPYLFWCRVSFTVKKPISPHKTPEYCIWGCCQV